MQQIAEILRNIKISLVAPASSASRESLDKLKNTSFNIDFHPKSFNSKSLFHSADDNTRFECLKNTIYDADSRIIWCLRGGYGSAKLIDNLNKLSHPKEQKVFVGSSDITALHMFFTQKWGWQTIHGPSLVNLLTHKVEISSMLKLANLLTNRIKKAIIEDLVPLNEIAKNICSIGTSLTGGNLTIITNSIGTNWHIKSKGKILFLEDINVKPYQIDRMMNHLKQAQILQEVKAIIFGNFDQSEQDNKNILVALKNIANEIDAPIFKTNRFGHGKFNDPIIYNSPSSIARSEKKGYFNLTMNWR